MNTDVENSVITPTAQPQVHDIIHVLSSLGALVPHVVLAVDETGGIVTGELKIGDVVSVEYKDGHFRLV